VKKIARDTDRDYFMSADESKEYGLIDNIFTNRANLPAKSGGE